MGGRATGLCLLVSRYANPQVREGCGQHLWKCSVPPVEHRDGGDAHGAAKALESPLAHPVPLVMTDGTADPAMTPASAVCPLETLGCHPYGFAPKVCPLCSQGCRREAVTHWGEQAPGWGLPRAAPQKHKQKGCGSLSAQGNEASSLFPPLLNQRTQGALPRAAEPQEGERPGLESSHGEEPAGTRNSLLHGHRYKSSPLLW